MISTARSGKVLTATMSRPPVNAMSSEFIQHLERVVDEAESDPGVAVLIFRSDQKIFCAGGDMVQFNANFGTPEGGELLINQVTIRLQKVLARLESATFVSIAEIQGHALGGGLELAMSCDLRVAAFEAKLGLTEINLGLLAAGGGTQRLTRLCGPSVAKRMILTGEMVPGDEAERRRLVQWSMPRAEVEEFTNALAQRCAGMSRSASAAAKACIAAAINPNLDGFAEEIRYSRELYMDSETIERVSAFLSRGK